MFDLSVLCGLLRIQQLQRSSWAHSFFHPPRKVFWMFLSRSALQEQPLPSASSVRAPDALEASQLYLSKAV